jgi:hypothetical protein
MKNNPTRRLADTQMQEVVIQLQADRDVLVLQWSGVNAAWEKVSRSSN